MSFHAYWNSSKQNHLLPNTLGITNSIKYFQYEGPHLSRNCSLTKSVTCFNCKKIKSLLKQLHKIKEIIR